MGKRAEDRPPQGAPPPTGSDRQEEPPPLEGDFAEEHTSPTFADDREGGLERAPEGESPEGYAGMDPGETDGRDHRG